MIPDGYKKTEVGVIPMAWEAVKLPYLTDKITSGGTPSRSKAEYFENGSINWVKTGELRDCYIYESKEKITKEAIKNSSAKLFPVDTLLVAMYGATIGQTAYLKAECSTNQACCAIIFNQKIANPHFYWKYFYYIKDILISKGIGAGQPNISQGIISDLTVPLPPLKEQEKIANILSTVDDKLDVIQTQIDKTETLKKGLLQKLLSEGIGHTEFKDSELGKIPNDWEIKRIEETARIIRGASPRPKGDPRYYGGNIPRLMGTDVTRDGKYVIPKNDYLTEEGAKKSRFLPKGTLTIVCSGTVGVPAILGIDACIHDGFLALVDLEKNVNVEFLYYLFSTLQEKFDNSATHGGIFTNLTTSIIKEFNIPVPPIEEQKEIVEILSTADKKLEVLKAKKKKYQTLKQGLLQTLLTGKIRVKVS